MNTRQLACSLIVCALLATTVSMAGEKGLGNAPLRLEIVAPTALNMKGSLQTTRWPLILRIEATGSPAIIETSEGPQGRREALTELMVRADVPIYVQPMEDQLRVRGTGLEQGVFETFVDMIDPGQAHPGISRFSDDDPSLAKQLKKEIKRKTRAVKPPKRV